MNRLLFAVAFSFPALVACAPGIGTACTDEFAYGLSVVVTSAVDGSRICDATVVAVDGDHEETLEASGDGADCSYVGAGERAGTYRITASKDGFASATSDDVVVGEDECHVQGEQVELELAAQEG